LIQKLKDIYQKKVADGNFNYLLKSGSSTAMTLIVVNGLRLIAGVFIARMYGATSVGEVALVSMIITIATLFFNFGLKEAILRFIPEYREKYNFLSAWKVFLKANYLQLGLGLVGVVFLILISPYLAEKVWNVPHLTRLFQISALFLIPALFAEMNISGLRAIFKVKEANYTLLLRVFFRLLLLFALTYFLYHQSNPTYIHLATLLAGSIFTFYYIIKYFKLKTDISTPVTPISYSNLLMVSFPMLITYSSHALNNFADTFILKVYEPTNIVGVYSTCYNLAQLAAMVMVAVNTSVQPKFSQLYHKGQLAELKKLANQSSKVIVLASIPAYLLLTIGSKFVLSIYGPEFIIGWKVLAVLSLGQIVNSFCGPVAQILNVTGNQRHLTYIVAISSLLNLGLNLILVPKMGMIGSAIASMISVSIWNIWASVMVKMKLGFFIWFNPFSYIRKQ
jgi:O-antigen/teichoic acid export membrane protein